MVTKRLFAFLLIISLHPTFESFGQNIYSGKLNVDVIEENKKKYLDGNPAIVKLVSLIINEAEDVLKSRIGSVTEKLMLPPSGDKHDYLSRGNYWWPDPQKADGIPYIRIDGRFNPENYLIPDKVYMNELCRAIKILGVAYYFTNDVRYVKNASKRLKVWFVDGETRANPNLNFAQGIPGITEGRAAGLIDTRVYIDLLDGLVLLQGSSHISSSDLSSIKSWFSDYLNWMLKSDVGKVGLTLRNNIGTAVYMQIISYSMFTGKDKLAIEISKEGLARLIDLQFDVTGQQPLELKRANSWSYSISNMQYWVTVANLLKKYDIDIWNHVSTEGNSLRTASIWLFSFADDGKRWTHSQIKNTDFEKSIFSLRRRVSRLEGRSIPTAEAIITYSNGKIKNNLISPVELLTE